jgi:exodeoxyribonuclease VII small subunit
MTKPKDPKFEDAIEELEAIIAKIESGESGLEESIAQYERGVKLLGRCKGILQVVEKRISELTLSRGGERLAIKEEEQSTPDEGEEDTAPSDP